MRNARTALVLVISSIAAAHAMSCAGSEPATDDPKDDGSTSGQGGDGASGGDGGGADCVPADETCDGVDNDCDGEVDEPPCACAAGDTQPCYSGPRGTEGIGECAPGTQTCDAMGMFGACTGEVLPAAEDCNGVDDDCNDVIDDMGMESCGVGACAVTITVCENGELQTCNPGSPSLEVCDGLDNDCDQLTDEGDPSQGMVCDTGMPGACAPGTQQCVQGVLTCVANVMPLPETCNDVDDDCNGQVDDGVPGTGGMCNTGFAGPCAAGTIACQGGVTDCFPDVAPAPEVCDGIDNDCEGTVDNQAPCPSPLTCSMGVCDLVCINGTIECNNACVDPLTDEQNCGMCNNACSGNLVCNNGSCQPPCANPGGGNLIHDNGAGTGVDYCYNAADSIQVRAQKACESHFGIGQCCVITGGYQNQQYGNCNLGGGAGSYHWHWDNHPVGHCAPFYVVGDVVSPGWCGVVTGSFTN